MSSPPLDTPRVRARDDALCWFVLSTGSGSPLGDANMMFDPKSDDCESERSDNDLVRLLTVAVKPRVDDDDFDDDASPCPGADDVGVPMRT